jgi:hypothetical protein
LFDPTINSIADSTGLWKPVPRHPAVVALAIRKLMAEKVFEPTQSELADACREAGGRMLDRYLKVCRICSQIRSAYEYLLAQEDRSVWGKLYEIYREDEDKYSAALDLMDKFLRLRFKPIELYEAKDWEEKRKQGLI